LPTHWLQRPTGRDGGILARLRDQVLSWTVQGVPGRALHGVRAAVAGAGAVS